MLFWHIWAGAAGDAIQQLVDEFNAANEWGIAVQPAYQGNLDQMNASFEAAQDSEEIPDILVGYNYQAWRWDGLRDLVDLAPYLADPTWGFSSQERESFYAGFWEQDAGRKIRLGVPAQRSAQVLYYNTTWARQLGFAAPPDTAEQFKEQACAAAQANRLDDDRANDHTGGYIISTSYSAMLGWIEAFGGDITRQDGQGYRFDTPQVEAAFTFLRELYDGGCAWLVESEPPEMEFAGRLGLFAAGSVANLTHQAKAFELAENRDRWTVIAFPSPANQPAASAVASYGPSFSLVSTTPEKQLAGWLFVRWLLQPQNQARFVAAAGSYPLSAAALDYLDEYHAGQPQWADSLELLPFARPEPELPSWSLVRWAVFDATTQLFRFYFSLDQVPNLVELLDQTAADLHSGLP